VLSAAAMVFHGNIILILMFLQFAPIKQVDIGEDQRMTTQTHVIQDRRSTSRLMARLDCHFTFERIRYNAVVINLSLKGAFLSSAFMPPIGSSMLVQIREPGAKKSLVFDSTVIHVTRDNSNHGRLGGFGVRFGNAPAGLFSLINKLNS
jgi:hypothetical protein